MRRVLIANRGEIALRAVRACRRLGLQSVAVHSSSDGNSPHVWAADHAVCIGPPPPPASYLNAAALIETAIALKCDAVYPGYGFLSERSDFAAKCSEAGLTFVGPNEEIVTGPNRPATISAARSALARFQVAGVATTIPFHERLLQQAEFERGEVHTRWVEQELQTVQ